ncbi:MAG: DUF3021 domain-containing protein [Lachnospiraceae bacterium]|nr:DUF3021 domain-containing protein [Lachnospiraceae bacterium]
MNPINKKNFLTTICVVYTILSVVITIVEAVEHKGINASQFNYMCCLYLCAVGTFVLSLTYRLERFSMLTVMIIQYVLALVLIFGAMWILGHFVEVNKNGPMEMWRSFTIPYVILAAAYYMELRRETKKQNEMLAQIKEKKQEEEIK